MSCEYVRLKYGTYYRMIDNKGNNIWLLNSSSA